MKNLVWYFFVGFQLSENRKILKTYNVFLFLARMWMGNEMLIEKDLTPSQGDILALLKKIYDARSYSFKLPRNISKEERAAKWFEYNLLDQLNNSKLIVTMGFSSNTIDCEREYKDVTILNAGIQYLKKHGALKESPLLLEHDIQPDDAPLELVSDRNTEDGTAENAIDPVQAEDAHTDLPEQAAVACNCDKLGQRISVQKITKYIRQKQCSFLWENTLPLIFFALYWIWIGYENQDWMPKLFGSVLLMFAGLWGIVTLLRIFLWERSQLKDGGKKIEAEFVEFEKNKS